MEETKNQVMVANQPQETSLAEQMNGENNKEIFYTGSLETFEDRAKLFNAQANADVLLNDVVGTEITIKDYYVEKIDGFDEETGEIRTKYKTIIFDENGQSYVSTSYGIKRSLANINRVFGSPREWDHLLTFKVVKNQQYLSLQLVK